MSLPVSLTRAPWGDDPTWARRWPGMKSSRLSPAGRLQGGACMLGSRSADSGRAGGSSGCPLWGRREEGKALQGPTSVGEEGTAVGGGQRQLGGRFGTQETGHWGTRLQAANACSQRYNGLLVRPRAGAPGGSGGGEAKRGGGEAGQERTCWTKPRAGLMASPSGALTAQPACSPRGKAENWGS